MGDSMTRDQLRDFVVDAAKGALDKDAIEQVVTPLFEKFRREHLSTEAISEIVLERKREEQPERNPEMPFENMAKMCVDVFNMAEGRRAVYHKDMDQYHKSEVVDKTGVTTSSDAAGGYLVPTEESRELINTVYHNAPLVSRCRRWPMTTDTLTIPTLAGGVTVSWTTEVSDTSSMATQATGLKPETQPTFGQVSLTRYIAHAKVNVTRKTLRTSLPAIEAVLRQECPMAIADAYDKAILAGTGTAATDPVSGLDTLISTSTPTWNASAPFDSIIDLIAAPEEQMGEETDLLVGNIKAVKALLKVKDDNGQYIYDPTVRDGNLPTVWGVPFLKDKNIVNTYGDGNDTRIYSGVFGRHAHIGLEPQMFVLVNPYRYSSENLVQFLFEVAFGFAVSNEKYFAYTTVGL